jgi:L-2,4-diaminobutyrate decarboxylase
MPSFDPRRFTHDLVDLLFDHTDTVEQRPVVDWMPQEALRELVRIDGSQDEPLALAKLVAERSIQLHHPSYLGHQVCPPFPTSIAADLLISTMNNSTAVFEMSPIGTAIEKEVVRWLANLAGYPAESEGTAVSGGSAANLTGLMAARAKWNDDAANAGKRPLLFTSADAHYSIARAAAIMGIPAANAIKVATDERHRLDPNALSEQLANVPGDASVMAIVATSGSTGTGAFDDLQAMAALRDRHRTWLHVDAAHGASVLLSPRLKHLVDGLELADSFSWDPHKMLWMPLSLGTILVRDGRWLRAAFHADAPYLFNARPGENIGEMTIQCSKRADAIKLWLTVKAHGVAPFADALEKVAALTRYAYEQVRESDDFEAMHEPHFNIFCFRLRGADDATNADVRERLLRGGEAWITTTLLRGQRVLRITVMNPRSEERHIDAMFAAVRRLAAVPATT